MSGVFVAKDQTLENNLKKPVGEQVTIAVTGTSSLSNKRKRAFQIERGKVYYSTTFKK